MKNKTTGKVNSSVLLIGGVVGLIFLVLLSYEKIRTGELKDNLPEYVVHDTFDEAMISAISQSKTSERRKYRLSHGLSNSLFLPFRKSVIVTETVDYDTLKKHDFVSYENSQGVGVIHRLVEKTEDGWVIQGDNNAYVDRDLVTPKNFTGKLIDPMHTWKGAIIE